MTVKYIKVPQSTYDSMVLLMAELKQDNSELEVTRLKLERDLQNKREEISRIIVEQNGGPVEYPEDDLPDDYS